MTGSKSLVLLLLQLSTTAHALSSESCAVDDLACMQAANEATSGTMPDDVSSKPNILDESSDTTELLQPAGVRQQSQKRLIATTKQVHTQDQQLNATLPENCTWFFRECEMSGNTYNALPTMASVNMYFQECCKDHDHDESVCESMASEALDLSENLNDGHCLQLRDAVTLHRDWWLRNNEDSAFYGLLKRIHAEGGHWNKHYNKEIVDLDVSGSGYAPVLEGYIRQPNVRSSEGNLIVEMQVSWPEKCKEACDADVQCVGFTFIKRDAENKKCRLKSAIGEQKYEGKLGLKWVGMHTYIKAVIPGYTRQINMGSGQGNLISMVPDITPSECASECNARPQCAAFTFRNKGTIKSRECALKSAVGKQAEKTGDDTYIKEQL